jgi:hypothetical protein
METQSMTTTPATRGPQAGDAVRLIKPETGWWSTGVEDGAIGIIDGVVGEELGPDDERSITFNYSAFRGKNNAYSTGPEYVECSGGPASIGTRIGDLRPTEETMTVNFWRWKDMPRGGGGEHYTLDVPLWEWAPDTKV